MERPFPAYQGDGNYIFASYSHSDSELVFPYLSWLRDHNNNVWYDEGIAPGETWSDKLADAILNADILVFFVTPGSAESKHCMAEVSFALDNDIPVLVAHLAAAELPKGMQMRLNMQQAIHRDNLSEIQFREKLLTGIANLPVTDPGQLEGKTKRKRKLLPVVMAAVLGLIVTGSAVLYFDGSRQWVKEAGISIAINAAALLYPVKLEQKFGIAVLPFVNMSDTNDDGYFGDGISEEILNTLVKTSTIPVIARTSSFQFKGKNIDIKDIGKALGVYYVLEGSVRKAGDRIRVTAQLIDARTGAHVLSNNYDRSMSDVFALQDEIAREIVNEIGQTLSPKIVGVRNQPDTQHPLAYELFMRGKQMALSGNPEQMEAALDVLDRALEIDPEFADAWVELAVTNAILASPVMSLRKHGEAHEVMNIAVQNALAINPDHPRAIALQGILLMEREYDWENGMRLLKRAVELNPHDFGTLYVYANHLWMFKREEAEQFAEKAYQLNPFDVGVISLRAQQLIDSGRTMESIAMMEKALELDANNFPANILAAMFNARFGRNERAKMYFARARDVAGPDHGLVRVVEYLIARNSGEKELAEEIKARIKDDMATSRIGWASLVISWNDEEVEQVFDLAIQQRNPDIFPRLFRSKPPGLSDEAWLRIRKTTRTSEAPVGNATLWVLRTHEEQARLKNQAIALPEESLDSYAGVYERKSNRVRNTFSLQDQKLVRVSSSGSVTDLVPMGDHLFEDLKFKRTHQFIEKDGAFSSLVVTVGQQTTVWEKVESGSL